MSRTFVKLCVFQVSFSACQTYIGEESPAGRPTPQYSRFEGNIKIARRYSFLDSNDLMIFGNNRKIRNDSIRVTVFVNRINQWNDHVWNDRKDWGLTRKLTKSIMGKLKHSDWDFHCWFFLSVKENKLIANERRRRALFQCFCLNITTKKNHPLKLLCSFNKRLSKGIVVESWSFGVREEKQNLIRC